MLGDIAVNKIDQVPYLHGANILTNKQTNKRIITDSEKFEERILMPGFIIQNNKGVLLSYRE